MDGKLLPVGLALSGGTAKAVAHVGVIKALREADIPIDHVSATSGGSIVATLYGSGMPISSMIQQARELSWGKLVSIRLSRLGVISSKRIEDYVRSIVGDMRFEDLKTPVYVVATDLEDGKKAVFSSGPIAKAVRASCSIPQIFMPVEINGRYYVDGGMCEYLPVETLQERGDMFVIASHLAHKKSKYGKPRNYLQLAIHTMGLVAKTNYIVSTKKPDILIHPDMDQFGSFDFEQTERAIEEGYLATQAQIEDIKKEWRAKSSRFRRFINRIAP